MEAGGGDPARPRRVERASCYYRTSGYYCKTYTQNGLKSSGLLNGKALYLLYTSVSSSQHSTQHTAVGIQTVSLYIQLRFTYPILLITLFSRAFNRSSFGAAPSHFPDRTLHPMRDFRRLLYKGVADPYEPCACDEDSRVKAIMQ